MQIIAKSEFFKEVVRIVREAMPDLVQEQAVEVAEGNLLISEQDAAKVLSLMSNPDELCELV